MAATGVDFVRGEVNVEAPMSFAVLPKAFKSKFRAGDTTPSVLNVEIWEGSGSAVSITNFDNGQEGQRIVVLGDGTTTVVHNSSLIRTNTGSNKLLTTGFVFRFTRFNDVWVEDAGIGGGGTSVGDHTHPFTEITGVATRVQLPAAIAYEDEANTFTLGQTIGVLGAGATGLTMGAADAVINYAVLDGLRISGDDTSNTIWNANRNITISRDTGGFIRLVQTSTTATGLSVDTTTGAVTVGTDPGAPVGGVSALTRGQDRARFGSALVGAWPSNAIYATFANAAVDQSISGNYALLQGSGADLNTYLNAVSGASVVFRTNNATRAILAAALFSTENGVDVQIGSLGRFDSTDVPLEGQVLFYHAGATNKWQAESLQLIFNAGDAAVALLGDNTSTQFLYFDPGAGADSPVGAPPVPVLQLFATHKGVTVAAYASLAPDVFYHDGPSFPADFRHFLYEYSTDNFVADTKSLATASSDKVNHGRLIVGTTYYYRARAVDRAGNASANSAIVSFVAAANSDTSNFGVVLATEIAVDRLAALSANIGIITAGQMRNTGNTAGINLGGAGGIPGTWTSGINFEAGAGSGSMTRYINFTATGSAPVFKHELLSLNADGTATFSGMVEIDFSVSGAGLRFKDTGVAHGITDVLPTDIYGQFAEFTAGSGGLILRGVTESLNVTGISLYGYRAGTAVGTTTTSAIFMRGFEKSGTGVTAIPDGGRIFQIDNNVSTKLIMNGAGQMQGVDGTATLPTWTFINDSNSGLYSSAADQVSVALGGVERARFSSTGISATSSGSSAMTRVTHALWSASGITTTSTVLVTLVSYTLPANTLTSAGSGLRITYGGQAAVAVSANVEIKFGSASIILITIPANNVWWFDILITRKTTNTQRAVVLQTAEGGLSTNVVLLSQTETAAINIDLTVDQAGAGTFSLYVGSIVLLDAGDTDV